MTAQIIIAVFGVTAIFLSQSENKAHQKYACLFGLAGQPAWFYAAITTNQPGIVVLCCFYTVAWARGVKTHWMGKSE